MSERTHSKLTARRPWMFQSRWRLFLTLFLMVAIPTAIVASLVAFFVSRHLGEQAVNQNLLTARLVAKQVDEEFFGLRKYVESFGTRKTVIDPLRDNNLKILQEDLLQMAEQNRKVARAFMTDSNGILRVAYPANPMNLGQNFSYRDWFKGASETERPYVSEVYERTGADENVVVTIATEIRDTDQRVLGFLGAQYSVRELIDWFNYIEPLTPKRIALFDQKGKQVIGNVTNQSAIIDGRIQDVLNRPEGWLRVKNFGGFQKAIVSHVPVPDLGWTVVTYRDEAIVFSPVKRLLRVILAVFLVALAFMGLLGWLWYRVLYAYAEDLQRSNKELENLFYSIAHDLRAPLRAMRGLSGILLEESAEKLDDSGKDYTRRIVDAAGRMDRLVNDLLEYGRVAHTSLTFELVAWKEIIQSTVGLLSQPIQDAGARIQVSNSLGKVHGDRRLLENALTHLLLNALKYVPSGVTPKIEIWSDNRGKRVRLWIKDNGIGIDAEYREKIFVVFQRLHGNESYSGTGIGLAIVRKAAERMDGDVGVESEAGKGSAFWIELPKK